MRHFLSFAAIAATAVLLGSAPIAAQESDEEALRLAHELRKAYLEAYNAQDANAVANLYTQNAAVTFPSRSEIRSFRGRRAIRQFLRDTFSRFENMRLSLTVESAEFLSPQVLKVEGNSEITNAPPDTPSRSSHSLLFQRQGRDGDWRIVSMQSLARGRN